MTAQRAIAVVLDGPDTPAWQARALARLRGAPALKVVELRLVERPRPGLSGRLHAAGERHVFEPGADPYAPVPAIEQIPAVAEAKLVVWLAEQPPPDREPREVVSVRHNGRAESAEAAFTRAKVRGTPYVVSEVVLGGGDRSVAVERTTSAVGPASELVSRTLALWKLAEVVPRAVERLPGLDEPADPAERVDGAPSSAALAFSDLASWVRAPAARGLFHRPWRIWLRRRAESPADGWYRDEGLVRWGDARLYADPFLFEHEGRHHLFCEEVPRGAKQGVISHTELRSDGIPADAPVPVLRASFHLSYPGVFAHDGEIYMIPETTAARRIELYRATGFPTVWRREAILLDDIRAADATIFAHGGRLWLFTAVAAEGASYSDELHLFSADEVRGPWRAHPCNPVVSDVRRARPAGAIQRRGSRIVRPAQDCSRRYGWALSFQEIDALTESQYAEHEVERLEPEQLPAVRATHTYAADGAFEAIDVRKRELRLRSRARSLRQR